MIYYIKPSNNGGELSFINRGDANSVNDPNPVLAEDIVGRVTGSIIMVSYLFSFIQTRQGLIIFIFVPGAFNVLVEVIKIFKTMSGKNSYRPVKEGLTMNFDQGKQNKRLLNASFVVLLFLFLSIHFSGQHNTNAWYNDSSDLLQRYLVADVYGIMAFSFREEPGLEIADSIYTDEKMSVESGAIKFDQGYPVEAEEKPDPESENDDEKENGKETDEPEEIKHEGEDEEKDDLNYGDTEHNNLDADEQPEEDAEN